MVAEIIATAAHGIITIMIMKKAAITIPGAKTRTVTTTVILTMIPGITIIALVIPNLTMVIITPAVITIQAMVMVMIMGIQIITGTGAITPEAPKAATMAATETTQALVA